MNNNDNNSNDNDQLNALVDSELDEIQRERLLARLDDEPELRGELCDIHRIKDLMQFAYPLNTEKPQRAVSSTNKINFMAIAASALLVLSLGFMGGYFTSYYKSNNNMHGQHKYALLNAAADNLAKTAITLPAEETTQQKVIIYLGSSRAEKFDEALNKAELLLKKYKEEGAKVYVVTSAGGIDLLRTGDTSRQNRIKTLSGLYKGLHFVACNNQIYQLHKAGQMVNLVDEAEVEPSAVKFIVSHLKKGWKYIEI
jgi:intracellular sulfur oxidation DsrE/DsrF family protein